MKTRRYWSLILLLLLAACTAGEAAPGGVTPSIIPTATFPPPTVDVFTPEIAGRTFLTAWEQDDYVKKYELLSPTIRAGLSQEDFEQAYQGALRITTAMSVTLTPTALSLEGERAAVYFEEQWHTALFGTLTTNNQLTLNYEAGQWWIDWRREAIWPDLATGNRFAIEYQIPPRGNIYDYRGAGLATRSTIVTVGVVPEQIEDEAGLLNTLSLILGLPIEDIQGKYTGQPANWFIPISEITGEESLTYGDQLAIPGIELRERPGRLYPMDGVGAHVVGWISPIPAEELETYRSQGYRDDEWVGISGIEAWGESVLAGNNGGQLYIVNTDGSRVGGIAERRPEQSRAIYTTLDRDLQYYAEQSLGQRRGAVVAIDIQTGAIRALVSGPTFDNNVFIRPTDDWGRQLVLSDPNRPLLNRATLGQYPSGSVFKIVTLAAALEASSFTAESGFTCPGYWDGLGEANRKFCWLETGHGTISLKDALSASCNVTFYEVGKTLDGLGQDILPTYGAAFGLGQATGLAEISEAEGLMPNPEWKRDTYIQNWATGDTVNLSIGQGYLLVTPLQIARMIAAVANGGTLYRPYLVDRIGEATGIPEQVTEPQAVSRLPISQEHLRIIQEAMLAVTTQPIGTATHRFQGLDIPVAGKTGTAEPGSEDAVPHSWFAGYFPADAPTHAMVVMVENAGEGSTVAAPMFRQILEGINGLPITPLPKPPETPQGD